MKLLIASLALILMSFMSGCSSSGTTSVHYSMYSGYHYPYYGYRGGYYYRPPAHRPPGYRPPGKPTHPIARPPSSGRPSTMPSRGRRR